jgi:ribosomal protein S17E
VSPRNFAGISIVIGVPWAAAGRNQCPPRCTISLCGASYVDTVVAGPGQTPTRSRNFQMTDMTVVQDKMKAIATAHGDYMKSSFEANKAYMEKLATIKAPDEAVQITTDHMKSAYETFVAEATKIGDMYKDFFKSAFEPMTIGTPKLSVVN